MKHLEFFNLKSIFSGLWYGPDSVNFFFYCGFWFSPQEIGFIWCTQVLSFSIKKKNLHKKKVMVNGYIKKEFVATISKISVV